MVIVLFFSTLFSFFKWVCLSIPEDFRALGSYCFHTLSCPIGMGLIFQRDVRVCSISHALWQPHSEFWRAFASDFLQKVVWNKQYKTRHTTHNISYTAAYSRITSAHLKRCASFLMALPCGFKRMIPHINVFISFRLDKTFSNYLITSV